MLFSYPGHESTFSLTWWRTHQGIWRHNIKPSTKRQYQQEKQWRVLRTSHPELATCVWYDPGDRRPGWSPVRGHLPAAGPGWSGPSSFIRVGSSSERLIAGLFGNEMTQFSLCLLLPPFAFIRASGSRARASTQPGVWVVDRCKSITLTEEWTKSADSSQAQENL